MKEENKLYLTVLDEYLSGSGFDFARHGMNKKDILNMVAFYQRILKTETLNLITIALLSDFIYE